MGHAAYMRGSRAISAQFCKDTGCWGCIRCKPDAPKATPRPADWGRKTAERADASAARIIASAERAGLPRPSRDVLALAVQMAAGISERAAAAASIRALEGVE